MNVYSRRLKLLSNHIDEDSLNDTDHDTNLCDKELVSRWKENLRIVNEHFLHEKQVWHKLALAAIRSAQTSNSAAEDKFLALYHRWKEIRLMLSIESLRRDAHLHSRHNKASLSVPASEASFKHKIIRSVLSLEHFPRTSGTSSLKQNYGRKAIVKSRPTSSKAKSSSAWEGTVYKHKLLTSLYYKLSLKLVFTALQVFLQQQRQRRRLVSSVPSLRERKLWHVTFVALVQNRIESCYIRRASKDTAREYVNVKFLQPAVHAWHRCAHLQRPYQRRLYVASIAFHDLRMKQIAWKRMLHIVLWRRKIRNWQRHYQKRCAMLQAWIAWRYLFAQRNDWRKSVYDCFASSTVGHSTIRSVSSTSKKHNTNKSDLSMLSTGTHLTRQECESLFHQQQAQWRRDICHDDVCVSSPQNTSSTRRKQSSVQEDRSFVDSLPSRESVQIHLRQQAFQRVKESRFRAYHHSPKLELNMNSVLSDKSNSFVNTPIVHNEDSVDLSDDSLSDRKRKIEDHCFSSTLSPLTPGTASNFSPRQRKSSKPLASSDTRIYSFVNTNKKPLADSFNTSFVSFPLSSSGRHPSSPVKSIVHSHSNSMRSQRSKLLESILSRAVEDSMPMAEFRSPIHPPADEAFQEDVSTSGPSKWPRGNDDDVDPFNVLSPAKRDVVQRHIQEKRSIWYFQKCRRFVVQAQYLGHCRRAYRELRQRSARRRQQEVMRIWCAIWAKVQESHRLCAAIVAYRQMKRHFVAWQQDFYPRFALHHLYHEHIQRSQYLRRLRRRFQSWKRTYHERCRDTRAVSVMTRGILRRVLGGWRSVIGQVKYQRIAQRLLEMRRLRPLFVHWKTKFQQKSLLRRVFTVQEHAWSARSLSAQQRGSSAHYFTTLHSMFTAWAAVVQQRRSQRWEDRHYRLALCFRGASLLARHFVTWKASHEQRRRLHRWYAKQQRKRMSSMYTAWKLYVRTIARPQKAMAEAHAAIQLTRSVFQHWHMHTQSALKMRQSVQRILQGYGQRRAWVGWQLAIRAKRLRQQLLLLSPTTSEWKSSSWTERRDSKEEDEDGDDNSRSSSSSSRSSSYNSHGIGSSDKENHATRALSKLQSLTQDIDDSLRPYRTLSTTTTAHASRRGSTNNNNNSSSSSTGKVQMPRLDSEQPPPLQVRFQFNNSTETNSNKYNPITPPPMATKSTDSSVGSTVGQQERTNFHVHRSNEDHMAAAATTNDPATMLETELPPKVWTRTYQAMKAKRFWRIWRNFYLRRQRYKRGFQRLESFFYRQKMHNYFFQWPGRETIARAEKMRSFILAKTHSLPRLALVDHDADEAKRIKQIEHTERRQRAADKALETALKEACTNMSLASYRTYRELQQQQEQQKQELEARQRLGNRYQPSRRCSESVFARSFLQRAPPTLSELAYALGYLKKIPDPEGLVRIKELLGTLLFHWRRHNAYEKQLRLQAASVRGKTRHNVLLTSLRKWIATTPKVSYRIVTWLQNAAEQRAFLDAQRWADQISAEERHMDALMQSVR